MKYWVHQNGRTIRPLDADALLDLAENDSLVSHGDRWVSLTDHPDFSYIRSAVTVLGSGESAIDRTDPRRVLPP
jgi:hypothetical protein